VTETVPFADLQWQWREIEADLEKDLPAFWESCAYSSGPYVDAFESDFAAYTGAAHVVGVNSGTSALHLALLAAGIRPGDKVLVPAMTFVATAWAVAYVGATPVFCDVEPDTGTIDVDDARRRIDDRTTALIPVDLYGQLADMSACNALGAEAGLTVIEDAAQSVGARDGDRHAGTLCSLGTFSFYPGKNLGAAGEAGAIVTDDASWAERMRSLRNHAQRERYVHDEIGYNYRLDGLQALILSHKLRRLDAWTADRRAIAARYRTGLADLPLVLPEERRGHVYHLYVVRADRRDELRASLTASGVTTGLHYPVPLHRQPCFRDVAGDPSSYPIADDFADRGLSLPMFAGMTARQTDHVISAVRAHFGA
jgi:dTDP-4-amino-4,6-dideoxygalactose transaminase